jgi:hypothetical protein
MWRTLLYYVIRLGGSDRADADRDTRLGVAVVAYAVMDRKRCFWEWGAKNVMGVVCFVKLVLFSVS